MLHGGLQLLALLENKCTAMHCGPDRPEVWLRRQVWGGSAGLAAVGALGRFLAIVVSEDDAGLLAAMDLWFSGELASDEDDGVGNLDQSGTCVLSWCSMLSARRTW